MAEDATSISVPNGNRILRRREVEALIGVSRATLYAWMQAGHFPRPIRLGPGRVGWRESVIEEWISNRETAS